jgi:DNA-binding PadR family transcriptional regulator
MAIRLTPSFLHILLCLADGPRHGYAILSLVDEGLALGPSSLYYALDRLERAGLIEETAAPRSEGEVDERRRYYRLTRAGRERLREETSTLAAIVDRARAQGLVP